MKKIKCGFCTTILEISGNHPGKHYICNKKPCYEKAIKKDFEPQTFVYAPKDNIGY